MSSEQVTRHRDELEIFAEHAWRLAESIGARTDLGYAIQRLGRAMDGILATYGNDEGE